VVTFQVDHLNPSGMRTNPAFTNVVVVSGAAKTIYIGAIDPVDATGALVGRGDIAAQTEQIFKNLDVLLTAAGATLENIIIWRIFIVQGQSLQAGAGVFFRVWGQRPNPPANTIVFVPELGVADSLITLEAVAVVPA
jgi:enamine deaminase RidA (YjgF/YER057c/UK114 family)